MASEHDQGGLGQVPGDHGLLHQQEALLGEADEKNVCAKAHLISSFSALNRQKLFECLYLKQGENNMVGCLPGCLLVHQSHHLPFTFAKGALFDLPRLLEPHACVSQPVRVPLLLQLLFQLLFRRS